MIKKIFATLLLLSCAVLPACTGDTADTTVPTPTEEITDAPVTEEPKKTLYYVRTPEQPPEEELQTEVYTYESLDEAMAHAKEPYMAATGYAVYSEDGEFLGGEFDELVTTLMYNGKHVCDYVKMEKYTYGNASMNPAVNYHKRLESSRPFAAKKERLVSCDRLVDWILYDSGFKDQPTDTGMHINAYMDPIYGSMGWCERMGFEKITSKRDLRAGDIVFVKPTKPDDPNFAAHVFMLSAKAEGSRDQYYRYDGGSVDRIQCIGSFASYSRTGQPTKEGISSFVVAYRPVASALTEPLPSQKNK